MMANAASEAQYVTFSLANECFAVPVGAVREILDHEDPFRIPNSPDYMLGIRDVRGQGVPVIDLRLRLGMSLTEKTPHTRILVIDVPLKGRELTLGLLADRVFEVTAFQSDAIEAAPDIGVKWPSDYITGVVRRDSDFVVIVNLTNLFTSSDAQSLGSVSHVRMEQA